MTKEKSLKDTTPIADQRGCGVHVRLDLADLGLDAAHIMWRQARGPDTPSNGLVG